MSNDPVDLRLFLGMLRRRVGLILTTVIVLLGLTAIALIMITPLYTGTALILVDPRQKNLLDAENTITSNAGDSARVNSEVELIRADSILLEVIRTGVAPDGPSLLGDPEFGVRLSVMDQMLSFLRLKEPQLPTGDAAAGQVLDHVKSRISAERRGLTFLIAVNAQSRDPIKAAELANAVAETHIRIQLQQKVASVIAARDRVQDQIAEAKDAVVAAEKNFDGYVFSDLDRIAQQSGRSDLGALRDQRAELMEAGKGLRERLRALEDAPANAAPSELAQRIGSQSAMDLVREHDGLRQALQQSADDPFSAGEFQDEMKAIETRLEQAAAKARQELREAIIRSDQDASVLNAKIRAALFESPLPADVLAQIYGLQQRSVNATDQYQTLLARAQTLDTEVALQVADSRIVSPAFTPTEPSFPRTGLVLLAVAIVSLGAGIGLAFVFETYIGGFTSETQVEAVARVPVAAAVPRLTGCPDETAVADHLVNAQLSGFAESFRRLRISVDQFGPGAVDFDKPETPKRGKVIMVSSALPGEGKSTVALCLARTLAMAGDRTVIVDCDLRRPSIQRHMDIMPSSGLADLLSGTLSGQDMTRIVKEDPKTDLTAVVGDRCADTPTDRLFNQKSFSELIASAAARFDYVILDTPPIAPVVDGLYLARYADAIVFVIEWAKTPQSECIRCLDKLAQAKKGDVPFVAVLNQQSQKGRMGYARYAGYDIA